MRPIVFVIPKPNAAKESLFATLRAQSEDVVYADSHDRVQPREMP